jgi:uncharacterized membrane protein YdjX (TVP38/TMEM64 family)
MPANYPHDPLRVLFAQFLLMGVVIVPVIVLAQCVGLLWGGLE